MKRTLFAVFVLSSFFTGITDAQNINKGLKQITPELLAQHINYLASDSMKGRNTPSPELDRAAGYIAGEFAFLGIEKVNGSYFQEIPMYTRNLDPGNCLLKITMGQEGKTFRLKDDYIPFEMTADTLVKSSLVFAGYGITAPEHGYDDYAGMDVRGKIVLVMKHEPGEKDSTSCFDGINDSRYSLLTTKVENAMKHGAIGMLVVTDPLNHLILAPQGYPWPGLSSFLPQDNLPVEMSREEGNIPVVHVGEAVIACLLGSVDSLKHIQRRIDGAYSPCSFSLDQSICELGTGLTVHSLVAKNVIGYLEGRDTELKKEYVVVGGHYDHVGFMKNHKEGEDYIFNGADDNASGTAGVLAVARAFAAMGRKPERSLVFILFAGEEKGLYGSKYYCQKPLFPLEKTVVMLNLDMISRNGRDTLQIDGLKQNPDLAALMLKGADSFKMKSIAGKEDLFKRSDHYNFYKKGISAVDITSGLHGDYHTVRDNPASVDPLKAATISRLTFEIAWRTANAKIYFRTEINKNNQ